MRTRRALLTAQALCFIAQVGVVALECASAHTNGKLLVMALGLMAATAVVFYTTWQNLE